MKENPSMSERRRNFSTVLGNSDVSGTIGVRCACRQGSPSSMVEAGGWRLTQLENVRVCKDGFQSFPIMELNRPSYLVNLARRTKIKVVYLNL